MPFVEGSGILPVTRMLVEMEDCWNKGGDAGFGLGRVRAEMMGTGSWRASAAATNSCETPYSMHTSNASAQWNCCGQENSRAPDGGDTKRVNEESWTRQFCYDFLVGAWLRRVRRKQNEALVRTNAEK
jgi:hypothetical protein